MCPALRVCSAETATGCDCSNQDCRHSNVVFLPLVPSPAITQRALCTRAQLSGNHGRTLWSQSNSNAEIWGPKQLDFHRALALSKGCLEIHLQPYMNAYHVCSQLHHAEYQLAIAAHFSSYFMMAGFYQIWAILHIYLLALYNYVAGNFHPGGCCPVWHFT